MDMVSLDDTIGDINPLKPTCLLYVGISLFEVTTKVATRL